MCFWSCGVTQRLIAWPWELCSSLLVHSPSPAVLSKPYMTRNVTILFPFVDCLGRAWLLFSVAVSAQNCCKFFLLLQKLCGLLLYIQKSSCVFQLVLLREVLWDRVCCLTWTILIYGIILSCTGSLLRGTMHLYWKPWTSREVHAGRVRTCNFLA